MKPLNQRLIYHITILQLMFSFCLFGQNTSLIDSLKLELNNQKSDTAKIKLLISLAQYVQSDTISAFEYLNKAKNLCENRKNEKWFAEILLCEGKTYQRANEMDRAGEKYDEALLVFTKLKIKNRIAECYLSIGSSCLQSHQYSKSMDYFLKALEISRQINDDDGISRCYYYMSIVYSEQKDYKTAISFINESFDKCDKKNKDATLKILSNMFIFYFRSGNYQEALSLADSIIPPLIKLEKYFELANIYVNIGTLYVNMKQYASAKHAYEQSIYYGKKTNNLYNQLRVNINLAKLYNKTNEFDSAIFLLQNSLKISTQLNDLKGFENIYYELYFSYEKKGDIKSAFDYYKKYIEVSDSIIEDLNSKKLFEAQAKYELDLKNEQIKLIAKSEQLAKQRVLTLGVFILAVIIAGVFYIYYKKKKIRENRLLHQAELKDAELKVEFKQRELACKAMNIAQQEQVLITIKEQLEYCQIEDSVTRKTIMEVLSGINKQLNQNSFEDFEKYFIEVHPQFYSNLKQKYIDLSPTELKICALVKLNLSTKQIADITGKTARSVENARYMIRKKMGLSNEDNLFETVSQLL